MPHVGEDGNLARALRDEWPSFFGFILSFILIGIMWMNHHEMFKDIERVDHTLMVLSLLLLLCIAFIPFPTSVLAEHLKDGDSLVTATLFYGGTSTVTAVCFNALWLYASRDRRLIDEHVSDARVSTRTARYLFGPVVYGLALPLVFITPWLTLGVHVFLAAFFLLPLNR